MARLRVSQSQTSTGNPRQRRPARADTPTSGSDKENVEVHSGAKSMGRDPSELAPESESARSAKRRRLAERPGASYTNTRREQDEESDGMHTTPGPAQQSTNRKYYDPFQSQAERQVLRKGMRDLNNEANDNRQEWIQPGNDSLLKAIERSDVIYKDVKQTSDATIDSRFLVTAGDLAHRRTNQLVMGDSSQGIDVDEFMGKAIAWMRQGTVQQRSRGADSDSEDEDGDALDWAKLGRACFRFNRRPPLPSFLLGPLDVQKRTRLQRTNNAANATQRNVVEIRPEEIDHTQIGASEAGPTAMSHGIHKIIRRAQRQIDSWIREMSEQGLAEEQIAQRLVEEGFSSEGMIPFFKLVVNPHSFGQTVENMFYVSFLIKDGLYGLDADRDGTLCILPGNDPSDAARAGHQDASSGDRHQAIFTLDHGLWRDIVEAFALRECLIPDRSEAEEAAMQVSANGWYN